MGLGCAQSRDGNVVVVYTSQDQIYATEILDRFTEETGIKVLALYDSESVKTTGLMNRLLAERSHPRCDVFWSNEELMVRRLAKKGILNEEGMASFGRRTRRMIINTNRLSESEVPARLAELVEDRWRGRVALAYPLYGTTVTHLVGLRSLWEKAEWEQWCRALLDNRALVVDGNSAVVRMVGRGEAWVGLTDSDDVAVGIANGLPIRALELTEEFPPIANSAATVAGCPHPETAARLIEFLQAPATVAALVERGALESAEMPEEPYLALEWEQILKDFEEAYEWLGQVFFR